jgi:hypothetical protein
MENFNRALFGFTEIYFVIFTLQHLVLAIFVKHNLFAGLEGNNMPGKVRPILFRNLSLKVYLLTEILVLEVQCQLFAPILLLFCKLQHRCALGRPESDIMVAVIRRHGGISPRDTSTHRGLEHPIPLLLA